MIPKMVISFTSQNDIVTQTVSQRHFLHPTQKLNAKCKLKQILTYEQEKHNQNTNKYKHKIVGMQHKCHRCNAKLFILYERVYEYRVLK